MRISTTLLQKSFGKYLQMASEGKEIIVTKNGTAIAQLRRFEDHKSFHIQELSGDYIYNRRVNYDEFLAISERSESQFELINGQIYLMAAPKHLHQSILSKLFLKIGNWLEDKDCEAFVAPYDVKLHNESPNFEEDPNVVQPDISIICDPDNINDNGYYEGVPTLVVEILSPSTRSKDMITKLSLYMLSGVMEYWVVDPEHKEMTLYSFKECELDYTHTYRQDEILKSRYFKGLEVILAKIFK